MALERGLTQAEINTMVARALQQTGIRVPTPEEQERAREADRRWDRETTRYNYERRSGRYECP